MLTQRSHRPVRARIRAYGSSNDGFAMQQRCIPGMLSWAVSLIRNSKFEASDVFPDPRSNIRHPPFGFAFPPPGPAGPVPRLHQYYAGATTSYCHLAALRFLRLAIPRCHSLCSLSARRVDCQSLELVTRYLQPGFAESEQDSPKFLGNLSCPFAMFHSDSGGTACVRPLRHSSVAPGMQKAEAPTKGLSELNSMAFELAVYASQYRPFRRRATRM